MKRRYLAAAAVALAFATAQSALANHEANCDHEPGSWLRGYSEGQGNELQGFGLSVPCRFVAWIETENPADFARGYVAMSCAPYHAQGERPPGESYRVGRRQHTFLNIAGTNCAAWGVGLADHVTWRLHTWSTETEPGWLDYCPPDSCTVMDTGPPPACATWTAAGRSADRVCLGDYAVAVDYMDSAGNWVRGTPQNKLSESAAVFYFFDPSNAEVLVKLLDACALTGHRWLYSAPATDLPYRVTVYTPRRVDPGAPPVDGVAHEWTANAGSRAADTRFTSVWAITDTEAFRCSEEP